MKAIVRTRTVGGSLSVTIPREIVKEESIKPGEAIKINVEKVKKDWFGCLRGMSSFTEADELMAHD